MKQLEFDEFTYELYLTRIKSSYSKSLTCLAILREITNIKEVKTSVLSEVEDTNLSGDYNYITSAITNLMQIISSNYLTQLHNLLDANCICINNTNVHLDYLSPWRKVC